MKRSVLYAAVAAVVCAGSAYFVYTQISPKEALSASNAASAPADVLQTGTAGDTPAEQVAPAGDLFSAGALNAQQPWSKDDVNAAAAPLSQANTLVKNANAAVYEDQSKKISMKLPPAWEARSLFDGKQKGIVSNFLLEGPGAPPPTCGVSGLASEQTQKLTQAKINEVMFSDKAISGLKAAVTKSGAKLVSSRKVVVDGVNAVEAILMPKMPKKSPDLTTMLVIAEVPGVRWQVACSGYSAEFDVVKADYDQVVQSISWGK